MTWPQPQRSQAAGRAIALVVVVVTMTLAAAVLVGLTTRDSEQDRAASGGTAQTTSTTVGSSATPTSPSDDLERVVAELSEFVEEARGLEFLEPVEVEVVDDDEFSARLLALFEEEDEEDLKVTEDLFVALGLIPRDVDLVETMKELLDVGVLGYYDTETGELVVRGTELTPYTRQTIVHELVHALDDQHFELERPELEDAVDERPFGFAALSEGNATFIQEQWEAQLPPSERLELVEEEMAYAQEAGINPATFPWIAVELIAAPYDYGEVLVAEILEAEGQQGLDEAFGSPPVSSEQVLHPNAYLEGHEPRPVDPPPADGEVFDEGAFGELVLGLMLDDVVGVREAREAAEGWGGDWYVAWRDGSRSCLRVDFATDTAEDREELESTLAEWAAAQPDAEVEREGALLRLTSCA